MINVFVILISQVSSAKSGYILRFGNVAVGLTKQNKIGMCNYELHPVYQCINRTIRKRKLIFQTN